MEKRKLPKETKRYIHLESITSKNELIYGTGEGVQNEEVKTIKVENK